jgi:hypothetical protein
MLIHLKQVRYQVKDRIGNDNVEEGTYQGHGSLLMPGRINHYDFVCLQFILRMRVVVCCRGGVGRVWLSTV